MDNPNLCVVSGWYADKKGHNNPKRAKEMLSPYWIWDTWRKYIEHFIHPGRYFIYQSNCEIPAVILDHLQFEVVKGFLPASNQHRVDFNATLVMGAQYALLNGMDFVYIEQDCLVYGLDKALDFAQKHVLCYGFEPYSFAPGWAEQSLLWIRHDYLQVFVDKMNHDKIWDIYRHREFTEITFHRLFATDFTPWPFGCGRKRPIDFTQDIFYAQQLSDDELKSFLDCIKHE